MGTLKIALKKLNFYLNLFSFLYYYVQWNPSRLGFFYFTFNNGSLKTCEETEKFAIRVYPKPPGNWDLSPEISPLAAPSPTSGGIVSSSPYHHWHFISPQASTPSSSPANSPVTIPSMLPDKGGGIPFINSNPAVPLPTGETDAAIIRPLPASDGHGRQVEPCTPCLLLLTTLSLSLHTLSLYKLSLSLYSVHSLTKMGI